MDICYGIRGYNRHIIIIFFLESDRMMMEITASQDISGKYSLLVELFRKRRTYACTHAYMLFRDIVDI